MPFDPNAGWLGGMGSDALYWVLTLMWTLVLALLGLSVIVTSMILWVRVIGDALDAIGDREWEGIGVDSEKAVDVKEKE